MVKWSRRRPLTPQTGVRLSYGSPTKRIPAAEMTVGINYFLIYFFSAKNKFIPYIPKPSFVFNQYMNLVIAITIEPVYSVCSKRFEMVVDDFDNRSVFPGAYRIKKTTQKKYKMQNAKTLLTKAAIYCSMIQLCLYS